MMEPRPVDRGWAWVICSSVFMIAFLTLTGGQVGAIGFLDMVKELDTTVTTQAFGVTAQLFAASIFALLTANVFVPFFGCRPVVVTGIIVTACASIGMSLSPNVYVFIIFGLMKGASGGSYYVPCVALVGHYFNKRRSLATTISICGTSVASIGPPRLVRLCVDEFGIRGTYLLLAAVELNMLIFALLLRPVSSYGPPLPEEPEAVTDKDVQEQPEQEMRLLQTDPKPRNSEMEETRNFRSISFNSDDVTPIPEETPSDKRGNEALKLNKDGKDVSLEKTTPPDDVTSHDAEANARLATPAEGVRDIGEEDGGFERPDFGRSLSIVSNVSTWSKGIRGRPRLERGQSVWSMMSSGQGSQAGMATPAHLEGEDSMDHARKVKEKKKEPACGKLRSIFDLSLFQEWRFCFLAFGDLLASSNGYLFGYFPTLVVIQGATKDQAATLQTVMGCVDLVGRLVAGLVADKSHFRPSQVSATGVVGLALMCHLAPIFTTFEAMIGMSLGLGLFIGVRQSLSPVVYTEVMGIARMSKSFSVSILMIAGGASAHSAFLSAIMESQGSTQIVWHYLGSVLLIYATILYCLPLVHRVEMKFKGQTPPEKKSNPEENNEC